MQRFRNMQERLSRWVKMSSESRQQGAKRRDGAVLTAVFLCAVIFGFRAALPERALLSKGLALVYQNTGVVLSAAEMDITFPLALHYADCRLSSSSLVMPLVLETVELSPRLRSLLWGRFVAEVEIIGYGGELRGWLARSGEMELAVEDVKLETLPVQSGDYRLSGTLNASATGHAESVKGLGWTLSLNGLNLSGLEGLGIEQGLRLGQLRGSGSFKGNNMQLESVRLEQGVLEAVASGSLIVGNDLDRSRLSLDIKARAGEGLPPMLRDLLTLKGQGPDTDGWRSYRLSGRLSSPSIR